LASGIPKGELYGFAVDPAVCDIVLENCGYISLQYTVRLPANMSVTEGKRTVGK